MAPSWPAPLADASIPKLPFGMPGGSRVRVHSLLAGVLVEALCWTTRVPCRFFSPPTSGNGIRCCFVAFCVAAFGMDSYFGQPKKMFLVALVEVLMGMVTLFGTASYPLPRLVRIRENPEFASLMACDKRNWPRCLAWHGWPPALSPGRVHLPWVVAAADRVDAIDWLMELGTGQYLPLRHLVDGSPLSSDIPFHRKYKQLFFLFWVG